MKTLTSAEAQNNFGELLDAVQREPVTITRRGRTAAFLVSPREFSALTQGPETGHGRALRTAARKALASFRGSGHGGGAARLVQDRIQERQRQI